MLQASARAVAHPGVAATASRVLARSAPAVLRAAAPVATSALSTSFVVRAALVHLETTRPWNYVAPRRLHTCTAFTAWQPVRTPWSAAVGVTHPGSVWIAPPTGLRHFSGGLEQQQQKQPQSSQMPPPKFDSASIETPRVRIPATKSRDASRDAAKQVPTLPGSEGAGFGQMVSKGLETVAYLPYNIMAGTLNALKMLVTDPAQVRRNIASGWGHFKDMMKHYWLGSKLLAADVRTASRLLSRVLSGHTLTRRERKQLLRTVTDVLRLVPFAFFVLVPFMELLLPVALKLFPNMLPSTFKSSLEREAEMKRLLRARLAMASFLQEAIRSTAEDISRQGRDDSAQELLQLFEAVRQGEDVPIDAITRVAKVFKDEITLDHLPRQQLQAMAQYMNLPAYGNDSILRFQIRTHLRVIKRDDQSIMWEGIDALNREELALACEERGMRSTGLTKTQYRRQLQQWLDLSVNKDVPASLLILSRALTIAHVSPEQALKQSLSTMEDGVAKEAVLESAGGKDDAVTRELKLASNKYQKQLMDAEEQEAAEAAAAAAAAATTEREAGSSTEQSAEADDVLTVEEPAEDTAATPLEVDSVETLTSLVADSALAAERVLLERATANQEKMEAASLLAKGRIGAKPVKTDSATERVKDYVNSMLLRLESQLEQTETLVGSKLRLLDRNNDGMLSADELASAISELGHADEDAWAVVHALDQDEDGMVSVEQFGRWAARRLEQVRKAEEKRLDGDDEDAHEAEVRRNRQLRRVLKDFEK